MSDLPITPGAHPAHDDDLLGALESAMFAPVFDYSCGDGKTDAWKARQIFGRRGVDVDAFFKMLEVGDATRGRNVVRGE